MSTPTNGYAATLSQAWPWIAAEQPSLIAQRLVERVHDGLTSRARATIIAATLSNWGLPVTADLIVRLAGGSKTMAVEVLRGTYQNNAAAAVIAARKAVITQEAPVRAVHDPGSLEAQVGTIAKNTDYLLNQLQWIQRSIDTERQLARHLLGQGTAVQPAPPVPSRRQIIGTLLDQLAQARQQGVEPSPDSTE